MADSCYKQQVLDVGTGSGSWALDFADLYPSSSVTSTDLSPILPRWLPPNLKFEVDDCQEEWIYHEPFDFIHVRGLYGSVRDWDQFYLQALQNLRPGGYLEQVEGGIVIESDDGSADNTAMREIGTLGLQAGDKFGKSLRVIDEMKNGMINAGFVDVTEHSFKVPIGPWPKDRYLKEIGQYMRLVWDESLEMWTMMLLTKILGVSLVPTYISPCPLIVLQWSREEVDIKLADVREDLYNKNIHGYNRAKVVYGRRPTTEESARQATV